MMLSRREAVIGLGVATAGLPAIARAQAASNSDAFKVVDPELRSAAAQIMAVTAAGPPFSRETLPGLRSMASKWAKPPLPSVPWQKRMVPGLAGNPDVAVYVVNAKPDRQRAAILHTHGGGFIMGRVTTELDRAQRLATALDCLVVSVDYRLAPETRYTGSLEDNYAALLWLYRHAAELGVDRRRIAVMGESAGGGHAALLALAARDRGEVPLAFQCLVYPMLDDRTGTTRAVPPPIGTIGWDAKANAFGWESFLGRTPGGTSILGVPGRAQSLANLPPTWIGVGSIDLFVQEDMAFAERLIAASVPVECLVETGAFHGFDVIAENTDITKRFTASKIEALRRALSG